MAADRDGADVTTLPKADTAFPVRHVVSVGDVHVWQDTTPKACHMFLYARCSQGDQWWTSYSPEDPEMGGFFRAEVQKWLDALTPAQLCDLYAARDRAYHELKENPDADL